MINIIRRPDPEKCIKAFLIKLAIAALTSLIIAYYALHYCELNDACLYWLAKQGEML